MANRDVGWNLGYFRLKHRLHNLRKSSSFLTAGGGGSVNITACFCFYDEFGSIFNFSSNELRSHTFRAYSIKIANLDRWVNVTYISYNRWCQLDYPRTILKDRAVGYWYTNAKESEPFTSILIPTCGSREHKKLILGMKCVHSVAARCYYRSRLDARWSMAYGEKSTARRRGKQLGGGRSLRGWNGVAVAREAQVATSRRVTNRRATSNDRAAHRASVRLTVIDLLHSFFGLSASIETWKSFDESSCVPHASFSTLTLLRYNIHGTTPCWSFRLQNDRQVSREWDYETRIVYR